MGVRALREHLTSCLTSTACWLLPYPGPAVSEDPNFKGTKEEMDPRSIITHQHILFSTFSDLQNIWASLSPRAYHRTTWRRSKSQEKQSSLGRWLTSSRDISRSSTETRSRNRNRFSTQWRR